MVRPKVARPSRMGISGEDRGWAERVGRNSAKRVSRQCRALAWIGREPGTLIRYAPARRAMNWDDEGIVLGVRRHGEANAIAEVMTLAHGRHLGLVRGGAGSRMRPVLQPGNTVRVTWRARLDEHLGHFTVEALRRSEEHTSEL